jgi:plasmid maintenance system killer protein
MNTRLTLVINRKNVISAKQYAKKNHTSVSAIVNGFFERLQFIEERAKKEPLHALIKEHAGSLTANSKNNLKTASGK